MLTISIFFGIIVRMYFAGREKPFQIELLNKMLCT